MEENIEFTLNGKKTSIRVDGDRSLLTVLRNEFSLTGTKYGCGEGVCGTCTVLIDNKAGRSCVTTIGSVKGREVVTIEGLSNGENLHPMQKAFINHEAIQCGFCTPGMVLSAVSLLNEKPNPSESEIITAMNGNLCRCGSHKRIIKAIKTASDELKGGKANDRS